MGAKQSDSATMVFARKVERGKHEQYEEWLRSVSRATSGFDGYRGTTIIRPATDRAEYVAIVQFDTSEHLDLWLRSDERNRCLDDLGKIGIESEEITSLAGLEHWVSHTGNLQAPPPKWKMAIIILVGLYPIVFIQGLVLDPLLAPLSGPLSLLVSLAISVSVMVWLVLPLLSRVFARWLSTQHAESLTVSSNESGQADR